MRRVDTGEPVTDAAEGGGETAAPEQPSLRERAIAWLLAMGKCVGFAMNPYVEWLEEPDE